MKTMIHVQNNLPRKEMGVDPGAAARATGLSVPAMPPGGASWGSSGVNPDAVSQTLASYLDALGTLGEDCDLAFLILATEIENKDRQISDMIKGIQRRSEYRQLVSQKLDKLRKLKTLLQGSVGKQNGDDAEASIPELFNHYKQSMELGHQLTPEAAEKLLTKLGLLDTKFEVDPKTGRAKEVGDTLIGLDRSAKDLSARDIDGYRVNADMLQEKIEQLSDLQHRIDSEREIEMVKLNALINKKGQATQLLSNILKKQHDTRSAVIGNFR